MVEISLYICNVNYYEQNYINKMKVSKIILEKLRTNKTMRLKTALALDVMERQVYNLMKSNSDNLTKKSAVMVYEEFGFTEEQIFEVETVDYKSVANN